MKYVHVQDYVKGWVKVVEGEGRTWHTTAVEAFTNLPAIADPELLSMLVGWLDAFRLQGYAVNVFNDPRALSWTTHIQGHGYNRFDHNERLDVCLTHASTTAFMAAHGNPTIADDRAELLRSMQARAKPMP